MDTVSVEKLEPAKTRREAGFTTLEMLVAMTLFAIVIGAVYGLLEVGRSARFNAMESNEAAQDVRVGLNTMAKDVLNAGVDYPNAGSVMPNGWLTTNLLITPDANTRGDNLTPVLPGYQLNTLVNSSVSPSVTTRTDQVTFVSTDSFFNSGVPLTVTAMNNSTGRMTLINPQVNTVCNIGDLLFVNSSNSCGQCANGVVCMVTGKVTGSRANDTIVTGSDPMSINDLTSGSSGNMLGVGTPAGAERITMVTYHVVDDGTGQGTGTLMRTVWGGNNGSAAIRATDQPLAFDVTAMTIQYYLQNRTITSNPIDADFGNIRQLTVNITVKSPRRDPKTNQNYIDTLSSTFNTRNLGYEKN